MLNLLQGITHPSLFKRISPHKTISTLSVCLYSQPLFSIASSESAVTELNASYPALSSLLHTHFASNAVLPHVSTLLASGAHTAGYGEANNDALLSLEQVQFEFAELNVGSAEHQDHQRALEKTRIAHALSAALPKGMTAAKYALEAHYHQANSAACTGSVLVLGKICTEGDNIPDGLQLAAQVLGLLSLYKDTGTSIVPLEKLSRPASWGNKFGRGISGQAVNMFF